MLAIKWSRLQIGGDVSAGGSGAIRDVLLGRSHAIYFEAYKQSDLSQRKLQAKISFLATFPRYVFEALGMVAIASLGALLVLQRGETLSVIPLLGGLALGAQRLLPALQQIFNGWASLKGHNAAIQSVLAMLNQPLPSYVKGVEPLQLHKKIRFEGIHFSYEPSQPDILRGLDLEICRGESIGFIGSTGSGKSTTVDLLMGLLTPSVGRILVDDADLHDQSHPERLFAWRASISHVPQSIYLSDSTIAQNIAFGVPLDQIDMDLVRQSASIAHISDFIESRSEHYNIWWVKGEFALVVVSVNVSVLLELFTSRRDINLDEATSALDNITEQADWFLG